MNTSMHRIKSNRMENSSLSFIRIAYMHEKIDILENFICDTCLLDLLNCECLNKNAEFNRTMTDIYTISKHA
jgi:hypothetical protein